MSLRDKMCAVIQEVSSEVSERNELIELIAIALLTRNNLFILGKPGQAKSLSINLFRRRITGARQFERLLSKQTDEEQLFGRIDLSSLLPGFVAQDVLDGDSVFQNLQFDLRSLVAGIGAMPDAPESIDMLKKATDSLESYKKALAAIHSGEPTVLTSGKIPEADIVFLDEIFKANDGVLNSLLTALNERKYTNEGRTYSIPALSFFAASNEIPNFSDPQEKILEALYDRLQIKVVTEDISDRGERLSALRKKQQCSVNSSGTGITLDELAAMQQEVSSVTVPDAINELADEILCEVRRNGTSVSDRKYLNYYPIAQAKAWLEGHDKITPKDLLVLKCYLWQKPGDRPLVESVLNRLCINPLQDKVNNIRLMSLEVKNEFEGAVSDPESPKVGSKALNKLRGELIRLYRMYQELMPAAQSDGEKDMLTELLSDLESISRSAHETVSFTYAPLAQLADLQ